LLAAAMRPEFKMNRRYFLAGSAAVALLSQTAPLYAAVPVKRRVRPSDPDWPKPELWEQLNQAVGGRLIKVQTPLEICRAKPGTDDCSALFKELKNPYFIHDQVGVTQTLGWVDGWTFAPSAYAVAARNSRDVVAAVDFARKHNLRLVIKGGGHSYLGTSNAPDSLLIWTHDMDEITLHDAFVAASCKDPPQPAVSIGAGAIWMHVYNAVTTKGGRYVQGGGCGTVGVAGLLQGGGFGSFSKQYGTACASLLEVEIVNSNGEVRIANACNNSELFWALKGGGGGTFGVVTRVTLKTHPLPEFFGGVFLGVKAVSDDAYRRLLARFVAFYAAALYNPHWGEIVNLRRGNAFDVSMSFQGLTQQQAEAIWQPFFDWLKASPADFDITSAPRIVAIPARHLWDPDFLRAHVPEAIIADDRPNASPDNVFWAGNLAEAGHVLYGFQSLWLPGSLLESNQQQELVAKLFEASRHHPIELHFQKGLAGGSTEAIAATRNTATNHTVLGAFVLAIIAGEGPPAYPGLPGHEPNLANARNEAAQIDRAMRVLTALAPEGGSYVAESNYFERDWQASYWGTNYARLRAVKRRYDPDEMFFARHGVGSEGWSDDGFVKLAPG
jgi:FAD/FMN-containing dehydrogenase